MLSKTVLVWLVWTVVIALGIPLDVQSDIVIYRTDADYSFGQHITFHLEAGSAENITEAFLFFDIQGNRDTVSVPVQLEPASHIAVDYVYGLVDQGQEIAPFAFITYWWQVRDGAGQSQKTQERTLHYADNRFEWQQIQAQQEYTQWNIYWVKGDMTFGQRAVNVAVRALDEINRELDAPVPEKIRIYIYPSEEDLQSALNLAGYDWVGGQARPELGVILVGIPDDSTTSGGMARSIPHELTHLLVYEATGRDLGYVPAWLDEGLASLNEQRPDPDRTVLVEAAMAEDRLFPLAVLCGSFPRDGAAARLAYAQSASVVNYLRETHGTRKIQSLLAAYAEGISCEAGVKRVLGMSLEELDAKWRTDLAGEEQGLRVLEDSAVWLVLWMLTIVLVLPLVGIFRAGMRHSLIVRDG